MIKIDVFVRDKNWKRYISNPKKYLKSKIKYLDNSIKFFQNKNVNFSILLAGDKEVKVLNKKFRKKNKTTDVLSFPFYQINEMKKIKGKKIYLGDIILNFNKINKKNFESDFLIQTSNSHKISGLINFYGIESPGLTSALSIAYNIVKYYL